MLLQGSKPSEQDDDPEKPNIDEDGGGGGSIKDSLVLKFRTCGCWPLSKQINPFMLSEMSYERKS